jgi:hypothetical protein
MPEALDERDPGQAPEADHADDEPRDPQAREHGRNHGDSSEPPSAAPILAHEDGAFRLALNLGVSLYDSHWSASPEECPPDGR